jgi:hypothetical protein
VPALRTLQAPTSITSARLPTAREGLEANRSGAASLPEISRPPSVPTLQAVPPVPERVVPPLPAGPAVVAAPSLPTARPPALQPAAPPVPVAVPSIADVPTLPTTNPLATPTGAAGATATPAGAASAQGSSSERPERTVRNDGPAAAPRLPENTGPDAGPRTGADVATPPSAAASRPRLNLELPRPRGGEIARQQSRGVLELLPQPPERKTKLEEDIAKAARKDCRTAYAGAGPLAVAPLLADAVRDKGCKW